MRKRRHLICGQLRQNSGLTIQLHYPDFPALQVINHSIAGIEAHAAFPKSAIRKAVKIDIGFQDAFGVGGQLAFRARHQITRKEIRIARPVPNKYQMLVVCREARRGEIKQLVVAGIEGCHPDGGGEESLVDHHRFCRQFQISQRQHPQ